MPHKTAPATPRHLRAAKAEKARKLLLGVVRDDSDGELGYEDHPWEWVYNDEEDANEGGAGDDDEQSGTTERQRSRPTRNVSRTKQQRIVGAKMGNFKCKIGDCVLLKAEEQNAAWVGIIREFMEDDEGDKAARFMCKMPNCAICTLHSLT
jgi:origin recognition complex subunit 1